MLRDVFISHATANKPLALRLCHALEAANITCWIAPRDIRPSASFADAIYEGIHASRLLVVLLSHEAVQREYLQVEVHQAKQCGLKIIPVSVDDVRLSGGLAIEIGLRQRLKLPQGFTGSQLQEVVDAIRAELVSGPGPGPEPVHVPDPEAGMPTWLWIFGGLALAASITLILIARTPRERDPAPSHESVAAMGTSPTDAKAVLPEPVAPPRVMPPPPVSTQPRPAPEVPRDYRQLPASKVVVPKALTNSLGMKLLPLPALPVLMCIHETRRSDFEAFVKAQSYDATRDAYSITSEGRDKRGDSWKAPGFAQTATHPVVAVSWMDATAFCEWLTDKEQKAGLLKQGQQYRLPSDLEWSAASGVFEVAGESPQARLKQSTSEAFPWGSGYPPSAAVANLGGEDTADKNWPPNVGTITGYRDGFARTAPVMSFPPNAQGFYDLSGNAGEWMEDRYNANATLVTPDERIPIRTVRGGDWTSSDPIELHTASRLYAPATLREVMTGFRIVLEFDTAPK